MGKKFSEIDLNKAKVAIAILSDNGLISSSNS